jgi:hypothetical protein
MYAGIHSPLPPLHDLRGGGEVLSLSVKYLNHTSIYSTKSCRVADPEKDPYSLSCRIRTRIQNMDPDTGVKIALKLKFYLFSCSK